MRSGNRGFKTSVHGPPGRPVGAGGPNRESTSSHLAGHGDRRRTVWFHPGPGIRAAGRCRGRRGGEVEGPGTGADHGHRRPHQARRLRHARAGHRGQRGLPQEPRPDQCGRCDQRTARLRRGRDAGRRPVRLRRGGELRQPIRAGHQPHPDPDQRPPRGVVQLADHLRTRRPRLAGRPERRSQPAGRSHREHRDRRRADLWVRRHLRRGQRHPQARFRRPRYHRYLRHHPGRRRRAVQRRRAVRPELQRRRRQRDLLGDLRQAGRRAGHRARAFPPGPRVLRQPARQPGRQPDRPHAAERRSRVPDAVQHRQRRRHPELGADPQRTPVQPHRRRPALPGHRRLLQRERHAARLRPELEHVLPVRPLRQPGALQPGHAVRHAERVRRRRLLPQRDGAAHLRPRAQDAVQQRPLRLHRRDRRLLRGLLLQQRGAGTDRPVDLQRQPVRRAVQHHHLPGVLRAVARAGARDPHRAGPDQLPPVARLARPGEQQRPRRDRRLPRRGRPDGLVRRLRPQLQLGSVGQLGPQ